ncbi:hypothetical protein EVAR_22941_1 [Eumeta japonica]|uniref:Uncharacterized protein n=1 Tax=Eumeta variegata TaxID=151549 RepID=A0A4C1UUR5_EUMVA|nr:hypothetical protein EVAR_22941_1 [Eumeta japonica]
MTTPTYRASDSEVDDVTCSPLHRPDVIKALPNACSDTPAATHILPLDAHAHIINVRDRERLCGPRESRIRQSDIAKIAGPTDGVHSRLGHANRPRFKAVRAWS